MEIKARDVDPVAVKKIDELARKKKMSRSAYIKSLIESHAAMECFKKEEEKYAQLCKELEISLINNTDILLKVHGLLEGMQ